MVGLFFNFIIPFIEIFVKSSDALFGLGYVVVLMQLVSSLFFFDALRRIRLAVERSQEFQMIPKTLYLLVGLFLATIGLIIITSCLPQKVAIWDSYIITFQLIMTNICFIIIFNQLITQINLFNRD